MDRKAEHQARLESLPAETQRRYDELTEEIELEEKKLSVDVPMEPEDRLAVEHKVELLKEERERLLGW
ncbi:hypothetical protein [Alkalicoccus urumqiensis]|uniref:DUF465 domain-containing protein n=1 Tax=Alkalicoccus urumqiensis TaxID=1548213 RepID=A0A2P6MM17_ALKUR|nr:hypothetical protein [Alkalicoccus urumqiensis]PRO67301.1 hypothetical protein C6I21_01720 [Alkalicoccus urumqiensis]